jgi:hypothetical protein
LPAILLLQKITAMPNTLVLIHGYSDRGESFKRWREELVAIGLYKTEDIQICNYLTLTNEVTIKDIAEGFDRALKLHTTLKANEPFDAMVHSTGMLVLRSWLTVYGRHERVKRIIAIAPASFGSPLAHKGRSFIGALFKGNRNMGPDFMEAGNLVLDGLELGSKFTWDLAHKDLLDEQKVFYGPTDHTPYVFTFCGNKDYSGLRGLFTKSDATDGTVRWSGCALNSRKITLDLTRSRKSNDCTSITKWPIDERINLMMPFIPVPGLNHTTIIEEPSKLLVEMVARALQVTSFDDYTKWVTYATTQTKDALSRMGKWQQFLVRARDERGDSITDYNLQLFTRQSGSKKGKWDQVEVDVHTYAGDNSYRCFHINLDDIPGNNDQELKVEFIASSGTKLLGYFEHIEDEATAVPGPDDPTFTMNLTPLFKDTQISFFYPFTTTLIEIILNREPLPLRMKNEIAWLM